MIVTFVPAVSDTTRSGAVLTTVIDPLDVMGPPDTLMPVPAVKSTLVTVPVLDGVPQYGAAKPPADIRTSPALPDVGVKYSLSLLE